MRRSVTLMLDEFGRSALESQAGRYSLAPHEFVQHAARHYVADVDAGRTAHRIPRYREREAGRTAVSLALELDDGFWEDLEMEAARQGVSVERLLGHATLYLIADLDSGRVAERMLEEDPVSPPQVERWR